MDEQEDSKKGILEKINQSNQLVVKSQRILCEELRGLFVFQLSDSLEEPACGGVKFYFLFCFIQFDEAVFCQKFCDVLNFVTV